MPKGVRLETPEKVAIFRDYDDVFKRMLEASKVEKENLDHQILLRKNELKLIEESLLRQQNAFEQKKREEETKLAQAKAKWLQEKTNREHALDVLEREYTLRSKEIEDRERKSLVIIDERAKLNADRIEVEKLYNKANELSLIANKKIDEANTKINNASIIEQKVKEKENKANALNSTFNAREEKINEMEKEAKLRLKNIEEVKKAIEPKIEELKLLEDNVNKKSKALAEKEGEVNKLLTDEKALLKGLEEKKAKLEAREKELLQKDETITRKALLAGIKNE